MSSDPPIPIPAAVIAPPFTLETATRKVRMAEDIWNARDPDKLAHNCTADSVWRYRDEFFVGRDPLRTVLARKWARELDYRLAMALWGFKENRMAVRIQYEWHDFTGQWYRSYGNELWEFNAAGLMQRRESSINDIPILGTDRRFHWTAPGPRPLDHPGIPDVK